MDANPSHDVHQAHYTPLPENPSGAGPPASGRRPFQVFAVIVVSVLFLASMVALIVNQSREEALEKPSGKDGLAPLMSKNRSFSEQPRGVAEGVSAKSNPSLSEEPSYNWTNAMFSWQRTAFHFQPQKNWMNGRYTHLFSAYHMVYNQFSASFIM